MVSRLFSRVSGIFRAEVEPPNEEHKEESLVTDLKKSVENIEGAGIIDDLKTASENNSIVTLTLNCENSFDSVSRPNPCLSTNRRVGTLPLPCDLLGGCHPFSRCALRNSINVDSTSFLPPNFTESKSKVVLDTINMEGNSAHLSKLELCRPSSSRCQTANQYKKSELNLKKMSDTSLIVATQVGENIGQTKSQSRSVIPHRYVYTPPPLEKASSTAPPSLFDQDDSCFSDSGFGGMMLTSTPVKSRFNQRSSSSNESFQSVHSERIRPQSSSTNIVKGVFDESVSQIVTDGDEEFQNKYSTWISQLFHFQLTKMQRRLTCQFSQKMDDLTQRKEQEIISLQHKYRDKLIEFEVSTERFQKWIDTLVDENMRVKQTKDALVEELQKSALETKENFRMDLERQINIVQADCEIEKMELQKKHAEQLKTVLNKNAEQLGKLELQYQSQLQELNMHTEELKGLNQTLEVRLEDHKEVNINQKQQLQCNNCKFFKDRQQLLNIISDLRQKLSDSEHEKADILSNKNDDILALRKETENITESLNERLAKSEHTIEILKRKHEIEIKGLQSTMINQEAVYSNAMSDLRNKYGHKISSLTHLIEGLAEGSSHEFGKRNSRSSVNKYI